MSFSPQQIADATGDDAGLIAQYLPHVMNGLEHFGIADHLTRVGAFATIAVECDWHWLTELGDPSYLEGRADIGNTQPGDGARFRGRGFVQLTGRTEYDLAGKALGLDLLDHPELAATPHVAGLSLGWYFFTHGIQATCNAQDWWAVRRQVNGGTNGIDRFIACVNNLLALPDQPLTSITTVATTAPLRQGPAETTAPAIGPDHKPVVLRVGQVVTFTPDPHTKAETTPHWAHVQVHGSPAHGWFLRDHLQTVEKD